jgi:hypothetical protein
MKGSAVSQSSRRFEERVKGDEGLARRLDKIRKECLLNVDGLLPK